MDAGLFNNAFQQFGLDEYSIFKSDIQLNNYFKNILNSVEYRRFNYTADVIRDFWEAYPVV